MIYNSPLTVFYILSKLPKTRALECLHPDLILLYSTYGDDQVFKFGLFTHLNFETMFMPPLHRDTSELGVVPCGKEIWT